MHLYEHLSNNNFINQYMYINTFKLIVSLLYCDFQ